LRIKLPELAVAIPAVAVLSALLFFAASLTPSLVPRSPTIQGVLSGLSASIGFGVGIALSALWSYLQLPLPAGRTRRVARATAVAAGAAVALAALWHLPAWQNSIRLLMKLEPVEAGYAIWIILLSLLVFVVVILAGLAFRRSFRFFSVWLSRYVPPRLSLVLGGILAVLLFWSIAQGLLFSVALRMLDSSFRELDALIEDGAPRPADPAKTGSTASLLSWEGLGRQGHRYISSGPSQSDINKFFGSGAKEPIRVYAGLNSAETVEERAALALAELIRAGGFDRSALVVIVPTGTGMVDPSAIDTIEYLHKGDIASVAMQYSYLASWLSLLVEPEYGAQAGAALFRQVYQYWTALSPGARPRLYLHGLSLGAMSSETSASLLDVIGDPFHGALWSGPPFAARMWRNITAERNEATPQWLPRFGDGSIVRFTNQENALEMDGARWGPIRIVYLQYASDPIVFFDTSMLFREPDWMKQPRGRDVSPQLRWYPIVTFLQLLVDMGIGTTTPMGFGHIYAPEHYIDAWTAVTNPGVSAQEIQRLKAKFTSR
jgi:uncharacterized membrane protein